MTDPQPRRRRRRNTPSRDAERLGHVTLTVDDIYDVLVEVRDHTRDLARDRDNQAKELLELKGDLVAMEVRVARAEKWIWRAAGAAAALGALGAAAFGNVVG